MAYMNVVVGTPEQEPWTIFCHNEEEWEDFKKEVLFTEERYIPNILIECGVAKSVSEVKKNKPELDRTLDKPDFVVVKWGKRFVGIQVG